MTEVEVDVGRIATGGEGVARAPDGRTLFVPGALPGERVRARLVDERKRFIHGALVEVLAPAPGRRTPPCPHVADGCGGCDWQHATEELQAALRRTIVTDALERIGRIPDPVVEDGIAVVTRRTTVRAAVVDRRAGYRRRRSHDVVHPTTCMVVHPRLEALLVDGRYDGDEVQLRVGARTGETAVDGTIHEEVAGRRWRISPGSFAQPSPEAAEALVHEVGGAIGSAGGVLVDLASGIGLFAGTVGAGFDEVVAVEVSPSAVADAEHNLADLGPKVRVVRSTIERWEPVLADVVVADPPRAGLARAGVERVVATGAPTVVLVSCDAASLGRDAGLLVAAGYRLERSRVLDLFPQTSHVEVVSRFVRG